MKAQKNIYRKNFSLITAFLVLITVSLVIAVIIAYKLTAKYVENEFSSKKIEVLEQTIKPYNDFFQTKIPEITSYQGFLDSASAANYSATVFRIYPFVRRILFYDIRIGHPPAGEVTGNRAGVSVKAIYRYKPKRGRVYGHKDISPVYENDFMEMAVKLGNFIMVQRGRYVATAHTGRDLQDIL